MLWSKNCWGIWLALGPLHLIDKESWVDGSGTTRYTEDDPPDHLEDEYQQLLKWYDWSQATYNSTSGVAWWDHTAIQGRFDTSVNAVQGALKADTSLEPQG
jgi:hypothetical protein